MVFQGETVDLGEGIIAIDDVLIKQGACPRPGNCDFEDGLCSWTNLHGEVRPPGVDLDWLLTFGLSSDGPSKDHTTGTELGKIS